MVTLFCGVVLRANSQELRANSQHSPPASTTTSAATRCTSTTSSSATRSDTWSTLAAGTAAVAELLRIIPTLDSLKGSRRFVFLETLLIRLVETLALIERLRVGSVHILALIERLPVKGAAIPALAMVADAALIVIATPFGAQTSLVVPM